LISHAISHFSGTPGTGQNPCVQGQPDNNISCPVSKEWSVFTCGHSLHSLAGGEWS